MTAPKLLLLLGQCALDPTSGAPRSLTTIAEMLARSGYDVQALSVSATENGRALDLQAIGAAQQSYQSDTCGAAIVHRFVRRGVHHSILTVNHPEARSWEDTDGATFDTLFDSVLAEFQPNMILSYGGSRLMIRRWRRARATGAKVVFGLRNYGYLSARQFFGEVDAVLTPSQFLSDHYKAALGIASTPLATPLEISDIVAPERDPVFFTFVNPMQSKGVMVMARIAEEIGRTRPDIPILIVESIGTAKDFVEAGLNGGFDLRRHANVLVTHTSNQPKDFFGVTRALLVPSVWPEPSGRVVAEALVNGVPPLVSDRGGLPEEVAGAGEIFTLPESLTPFSDVPVSADAVQDWISAIETLADDETAYTSAVALARKSAQRYAPDSLRTAYRDFFDAVIHGSHAPLVGDA